MAATRAVSKAAGAAATLPEAVASTGPNFRVGQKKIYLPNHRLTFVEPKPNQPPTWATFIVPLTFNKFDMRDYLYHVYKVEVTAVRSFITPAPLREMRYNHKGEKVKVGTQRPQPRKMMTVELVNPFLFPEAPEDKSAWDAELSAAMQRQVKDRSKEFKLEYREKKYVPPSDKPVTRERVALAQQARALREGKIKWTNDVVLDEKWAELKTGEDAGEDAISKK